MKLDNLVYAADKLVKQDLKDKIKPDQADKINKAAQELRESISRNDIDDIRTKTQELKKIIGEVSTEVYRTAGATSGADRAGRGLQLQQKHQLPGTEQASGTSSGTATPPS